MLSKIMLTSPLATGARRLTRRAGLNRLVSRLMRTGGYEGRFGPELLKWVSAGDCVWDVGANVGFYTARFAEKAGKGAVVAFEPAGSCYQELVRRCGDWSQVITVKVALGAEDGVALMVLGDDPLSTTNRLRTGGEGHEGAVLDGMRGLLCDRRLHCVGVEVHFGILQERGESRRPLEIQQAMEAQGFRVKWTDMSHIIGVRKDR